jgi:hypothetical protein
MEIHLMLRHPLLKLNNKAVYIFIGSGLLTHFLINGKMPAALYRSHSYIIKPNTINVCNGYGNWLHSK